MAIDAAVDRSNNRLEIYPTTLLIDPFNGKSSFAENAGVVPLQKRVIIEERFATGIVLDHTIESFDKIDKVDSIVQEILTMMSRLSDEVCDDMNNHLIRLHNGEQLDKLLSSLALQSQR